MDIWDSNKLLIFIAFAIPGFISLKAYSIICPGLARDSDKLLIDAVTYSSINYAILFWPIYEIETRDIRTAHGSFYVAFYVFVLLIAPVVWAFSIKFLRETSFGQRAAPHPTGKPWDFVFGRRKKAWVIINLKSGDKIAGLYSGESFASSAPAAEQIYLQETWVLNTDGGFDRPREDTAGILVTSTEIASIEFFKITYGEQQ